MKKPPLNFAIGITLMRFFCIPVFIALLVRHRQVMIVDPSAPELTVERVAALCVFVFAAISDALDGFVARHFNQQTTLGAWLDPMADKLLLCAAIIALSLPLGIHLRFPFWFPIVVLTRDVVIVLGTVIIFMLRGHVTMKPLLSSKVTTVCQMACVIAVLMDLQHLAVISLLAVTVVMTAFSCVQYINCGLHLLADESQHRIQPPC